MLGRVQQHLEAIYGIRCELRVSDFLVDEEVARRLGGGRAGEELLLSEENGELGLALYIPREVLARLSVYESSPTGAVLEVELGGYCELAEGVSHVLYLTHAAAHSRTVSLLELEAQAEVDKFATCVLLRWSEGLRWGLELSSRLFERVSFRPGLSEPERWRYLEANRLARAYCRRLLRLVAAGSVERFLTELRYSYRLGAEAKLRYLAG
ncbi:MAG: hypothetical protein HYZ28_03705 [Myxococcales bacterium]|nr:hypothetical protein [Myxococcales bacterium]